MTSTRSNKGLIDPNVTRVFEDFLNRAQTTSSMLGFSPSWGPSLLSSMNEQKSTSYPPYDVYQFDEDTYEVHVALAGFSKDQIHVTVEKDVLKIHGEKQTNYDYDEAKPDSSSYPVTLHKGIGGRKFSRSFILGNFLKIGKASFNDGILKIRIVREVPEESLPKQIPIL